MILYVQKCWGFPIILVNSKFLMQKHVKSVFWVCLFFLNKKDKCMQHLNFYMFPFFVMFGGWGHSWSQRLSISFLAYVTEKYLYPPNSWYLIY